MKVVAIIPARGGSKGIPKKNIIPFCGHPLLAWSIGCARRCAAISAVYVSTDCPQISAIARRYGAETVQRPPELSTDTATSESALLHAVQEIEITQRGAVGAVVFLQATSPLRETDELDGALARFQADDLDSLFCAAELEDMLVWKEQAGKLESWNYDFRNRKRRQDATERQFVETGSFYITKTALLRKEGNRLGGRIGTMQVPFWKCFEIDSLEGLAFCELLMKAHKLDLISPQSQSN